MAPLLVVLVVGIIGTAVVQGIQAENEAQAMSDAAKAEGLLRKAESDQNARQMRKSHSRTLAEQRVMFGKLGVNASQGTPLDVLAENAGEFELDAVTRERFGQNALEMGLSTARNAQEQGRLKKIGIAFGALSGVATAGLLHSAQPAPTTTGPTTTVQSPGQRANLNSSFRNRTPSQRGR